MQGCGVTWSSPILSTTAVAGLFAGPVVLPMGLTAAPQMDGSVGMSKGSPRMPTTNPTNEDLQLLPDLFVVRGGTPGLVPSTGKGKGWHTT